MIVSTQLFEAHLECPTKCWLRSRAEPAPGNIYAEWVRVQNSIYSDGGIKRLLASGPKCDLATGVSIEKNLVGNWRLAVDLCLRTNKLESHLRAAERTSPEARGRPVQFVPYRFQFANKLTKNDKLSLAFDAFVLSEVVGSEVSFGKITHGDGHVTRRVKLSPLASEVQERVKSIAALLAQDSPPDLVLNRHCSECEFQTRCHRLATDRDELSLLSGMSETERKKLHGKGIFTVTQLSYTFRPRRRRRRSQGKQEKFHHSLRALAIRENKIHAADLLDPRLNGTLVYLDVEGLPDRDFYYLIGIRVRTADGPVQYGFWADDEVGEKRIWNELLDTLSTIRDAQLVHFGSYETVFLKRMRERHGAPPKGSAVENAIEHPVNLLSLIFARIYFPTFTNGLKEIAGYLGFQWSGPVASGLDAIVWRQRWEISRDPKQRKALLDYNREDCEALEAVADKLIEIHHASPTDGQAPQNDVVHTSKLTRQGPFVFKRNEFVFPEMESINKAAYWDYQRERVYVKSRHKISCKRKRCAASRSALSPNATVEYARPSFCPTCKSKLIYRHGKRRKIVVDLRFMRHGVKRWVTRHVAQRYRCPSCRSTFFSPVRRWTSSRYGPHLMAYIVYQTIELGLPQNRIVSCVERLFGLRVSRNTANRFKILMAQAHLPTYDLLLRSLCSGRLLHVDETSAGAVGRDGYVWVITSMEEVAYLYTPTREGHTIQEMLKDFSGVLVSDFYSVYDAMECPQQKCLIHFIRDLNDELLNHAYDEELKQLIRDFANLLKSIIDTVERHGLKRRFLGKHLISVNQFYRRLAHGFGASEAAKRIIERLHKNRNKLFTFLEFDDVPWNNNNAEHAIKAFATLRRVIEGRTTEKSLHDFLILLSICETCKYKNIDFLEFLRSGSKNIDDFAQSNRRRLAG